MKSAVNRTLSSAVGRLVKTPLFDVSDFDAGDNIILADDHAQSGGFFHSALSSMPDGVEVIAVAALTRHPLTKSLLPDERLLDYARDIEGFDKVARELASYGLTPDTMTNRELLTVVASLSPPEKANEVSQLMHDIGNNADFAAIESSRDSIEALLNEPALTPRTLIQDIRAQIPANKQVTLP